MSARGSQPNKFTGTGASPMSTAEPVSEQHCALKTAQRVIAIILENGGLNYDIWFEDLICAQQTIFAALSHVQAPGEVIGYVPASAFNTDGGLMFDIADMYRFEPNHCQSVPVYTVQAPQGEPNDNRHGDMDDRRTIGRPSGLADLEVLVSAAWDDLVNKDDRTSPEDCPDMALITRDELTEYLALTSSHVQAPVGHMRRIGGFDNDGDKPSYMMCYDGAPGSFPVYAAPPAPQVQATAEPWQHVREAINHCIDLPLDGYQPSITQETAAAAISCVDMFEALGFPVGKIFPPDNEAMAFTWEHGGKKLYITSSHEDDKAYFLNATTSPAPQVDEAMVERGAVAIHDHWQNNLTPWAVTCKKQPGAADFFRDISRKGLEAAIGGSKP